MVSLVITPVVQYSPAQTFHTASQQLPPVPHPRQVVDSGTPSPDTSMKFTPSSQFGPAPQPSVHNSLIKFGTRVEASRCGVANSVLHGRL